MAKCTKNSPQFVQNVKSEKNQKNFKKTVDKSKTVWYNKLKKFERGNRKMLELLNAVCGIGSLVVLVGLVAFGVIFVLKD